MKRLLLLIALVNAPVIAMADIVVMQDGRVLKGQVELAGKELVIKGPYGSVRVLKSKVKDWKTSSPEEAAFAKLKAQLGQGTADERYRLGVFARNKRLSDKARKAFQSVLLVNSDHAGARAALGYVKHQGLWITESDKARMEGKVRYQGRWLTLEEKAQLFKAAREKREQREKTKIEKRARKKLRRNLLRQKRRGANRSTAPLTGNYGDPDYPGFSADRYRLLDSYYGPYFPASTSAGGYRSVSGSLGIPGFLGPRSLPLYRGLSFGPRLSYQEQLIAAAALRQGRTLPLNLTRPLRVIQSPGFGVDRRYGPALRQSNYSFGSHGRFSGGRLRFTASGSRSSGLSSFITPAARTIQSRSTSRFGISASGAYRSRSGRSRIQFRFTP
jgi:hypothetical protein